MLVAAAQQDDQGTLGAKVSTSDHLYQGGAMVEADCLGHARRKQGQRMKLRSPKIGVHHGSLLIFTVRRGLLG
jgi:hypothetical protein